jgi:hypothetical protein
MKYIKRFNESIEELLSEVEENIEGLSIYIAEIYRVNVVTRASDNNQLLGIYVSLELPKQEDVSIRRTLFETNSEIKDCFDTIVDYVKTKFDNLKVGYYYSGSYESYLSEDFHYDKFIGIELVIEDKDKGKYFNEYKYINRK